MGRYERRFTVGVANNGGPAVFGLELRKPAKCGKLMLEAWISNFGSSNVHILEGMPNLAQAPNFEEQGFDQVLMTVTGSGPCRVGLPDDTSDLTVFFEAQNTSAQAQLVTVRVYECPTY